MTIVRFLVRSTCLGLAALQVVSSPLAHAGSCASYMAQSWQTLQDFQEEADDKAYSFLKTDLRRSVGDIAGPTTEKVIKNLGLKKAKRLGQAIKSETDEISEYAEILKRLNDCQETKCGITAEGMESGGSKLEMARCQNRCLGEWKKDLAKKGRKDLAEWAKLRSHEGFHNVIDRVREAGEFLQDYSQRIEQHAEDSAINTAECLSQGPRATVQRESYNPPTVKLAPKPITKQDQPAAEEAPASGGPSTALILGGVGLGVVGVGVGAYLYKTLTEEEEYTACVRCCCPFGSCSACSNFTFSSFEACKLRDGVKCSGGCFSSIVGNCTEK